MVEQQGSGVSAAGLVERLRTDAAWLKRRSKCEVVAADIAEAADTIEALTAQLTRQSEAAGKIAAALDLARNRLSACTVAAIAWGKARELHEWSEWTAEARAAIQAWETRHD